MRQGTLPLTDSSGGSGFSAGSSHNVWGLHCGGSHNVWRLQCGGSHNVRGWWKLAHIIHHLLLLLTHPHTPWAEHNASILSPQTFLAERTSAQPFLCFCALITVSVYSRDVLLNLIIKCYIFHLGKRSIEKKNVFFRALPELPKPPPPPPLTPIWATWSSFFGRQNSRFESQFRTKNTIYTI